MSGRRHPTSLADLWDLWDLWDRLLVCNPPHLTPVTENSKSKQKTHKEKIIKYCTITTSQSGAWDNRDNPMYICAVFGLIQTLTLKSF